MVQAGTVYATATEDMDCLTFGSAIQLRYLTASEAKYIRYINTSILYRHSFRILIWDTITVFCVGFRILIWDTITVFCRILILDTIWVSL